jgi:bifunctional DNA-binding transcriptional regulator/antitoxin component of YhaV-PrlF toxin-antitoxin module
MFKTTIQSGGRISIPEAERQALKIDDGDLVQVIVIPIERKHKNSTNK